MGAAQGRGWRRWLAAVAWLGLTAVAGAQPRPGVLLTPAELQRALAGPAPPLVLDASDPGEHRKAHIAGAVPVDYFRYGLRDGTLAERARWLQSLGIGRDRRVVVYDGGGTWMAPRLFHELVYSGLPEDRVALLDGGLTRWRAEGLPVTDQPSAAPPPGDLPAPAALRADLRVRLDDFMHASGDPRRHLLLDALGPDHYFGGAKFFDRAGHVPQAVNGPAEDFFDPVSKAFKPPAEIRRMADWWGLRPEQTVHTHCGGGGAAAVPWFALRYLLGHPQVTLYRESQREWLRDERGLPYWTLARPQLQRPASWLAAWNSPMMRAIGAAGLVVIDTRPAAAYAQGHLPASVNLPAEELGALARDPAALAARLAAAGVDPALEAVVVGEGGLIRGTALALLVLAQAGQARASWLQESVDEWGLRGHPLTRDPAATAPARTAAPPAATGPLLAAGEAPGPHPRGHLLVGAGVPQRSPAGTWPRVTVEQLLGAEGMLRPAHELWKALSQAGLKRYGETVVVADDPGDAAVAWAVLRALGFESVRVAAW